MDERTRLIGRDTELAELVSIRAEHRVVTIVGPGGAGKTTLARAATESAGPGEVAWVDLADTARPDLVLSGVCAALDVPAFEDGPESVIRALDLPVTIVLDNAEHVRDACAAFVADLVRLTARPRVLTTSREPLDLIDEQLWRIPPLALPGQGAGTAEIAASPAVQLFVARARRAVATFTLDGDNADAIADVCRRLDGLPLALELAAARVQVMSPGRILDELDDRFHLLTGGSHRSPARQRTLRASMEWSHGLLTTPAQVLLRRLAVFVGGFTVDAVEAVAGEAPLEQSEVLDLLTGLVDRSLVEAEGDDRLRLLESVRSFAHEELVAAGEVDAVGDAHLGWVRGLVRRAAPHLVGADQRLWMRRLGADHANIGAAIDRAAVIGDAEALWELTGALGHYFVVGGHFAEASNLFLPAESVASAVDDRAQLPGRWSIAYTSLYAGSFERATVATLDLVDRAEAVEDARWLARGLDVLGTMSLFFGFDEARTHLERAAALAADVGDEWCHCDALQVLAYTYLLQDDHPRARRALDAAAPSERALGNHQLHAWQLVGDASIELRTGSLPRAAQLCDAAFAAAQDANDPASRGLSVILRGHAALVTGRAADLGPVLVAELERCIAQRAGLAAPGLAALAGLCTAAAGDPTRALEILDSPEVAAVRSDLDRDVLQAKCRALVHLAAGNRSAAEATAGRGVVAAEASGSPAIAAGLRLLLARLVVSDGETSEPHEWAMAALGASRDLPIWEDVVDGLQVLGAVAMLEGRLQDAARLFGGARGVLERAGAATTVAMALALDPIGAGQVEELLGGHPVEFAEGAALGTDDLLDWVSRARGSRRRPATGWDSLTVTERKVADLLAEGLTNHEIGERLFVSAGTVKTHLAHAYTKLGMRNRTEVAAEVMRRRVPPPGESGRADRR